MWDTLCHQLWDTCLFNLQHEISWFVLTFCVHLQSNSCFDWICCVFSHVTSKKEDRNTGNYFRCGSSSHRILLEKKSIRPTAKEHGFDKSTLQRYLEKVKSNYDEISSAGRDALLEFIRTCSTKTQTNMICLFCFLLRYFSR